MMLKSCSENQECEWVSLFGDTESEIKKSFRFQFLTQNGFCISGVYPVRGRADLVNV